MHAPAVVVTCHDKNIGPLYKIVILVFLQDNGPAAQYMFALIEHHSLSRCSGTHRCIEGTEYSAIRLFCKRSMLALMIIADLRQYPDGFCDILHCHIIHIFA